MKRLIFVVLLLVAMVSTGYAVESCTPATSVITNDQYVLTYTFTTAADGTLAACASSSVTGYITLVVTDPGSTAPTALYDLTLTSSTGVDVMGGALANRSATATEQAMPYVNGATVPRFVNGTLTMNLTNNAVNSATGVVYVYFQR